MRKALRGKWLTWPGLILILILISGILTGCGSRDAEALEDELAYRKLGIEKLQAGEYEEAVTLFQRALDQSMAQIDELEIDICYYKAQAQYKAGDVAGALETYGALIDYDKKNADGYFLRGTLYLVQGQTENAWQDYQQSLTLDSRNGKRYNTIAESLMEVGQQEYAVTVLGQALEVNGQEPEDYREKGYSYYLLEDYENARTYLDRSVNLEDQEAVFYLAQLLEAQGSVEQASQLYENYLQDHQDDTELLNSMGCDKMAQGDYQQALLFFQTALAQENPLNEQTLRWNEMVALEQLLDFAGAREKLEAYLEDYPEDEKAQREYVFLQTR